MDEAAAAANPFGRAVLVTATEHGRLSNWCVAPVGLDAEAARLGLQSVSGSRVRPDGTRLQWRSMGLDESIAEPSLPFFIEWQVEPRLHPGRGSAEHRTAPTGIAWVEVSGDPARIRGWLGEESAGLPIRIVAGPPAMLAVGIGTASGEVVIR